MMMGGLPFRVTSLPVVFLSVIAIGIFSHLDSHGVQLEGQVEVAVLLLLEMTYTTVSLPESSRMAIVLGVEVHGRTDVRPVGGTIRRQCQVLLLLLCIRIIYLLHILLPFLHP